MLPSEHLAKTSAATTDSIQDLLYRDFWMVAGAKGKLRFSIIPYKSFRKADSTFDVLDAAGNCGKVLSFRVLSEEQERWKELKWIQALQSKT